MTAMHAAALRLRWLTQVERARRAGITLRDRMPRETPAAERMRQRTREKRGVEEAGFAAMLARQGGGCALCGGTDRLIVDHNHATNATRGILCSRCNTRLGQHGDALPAVIRSLFDAANGRNGRYLPSHFTEWRYLCAAGE